MEGFLHAATFSTGNQIELSFEVDPKGINGNMNNVPYFSVYKTMLLSKIFRLKIEGCLIYGSKGEGIKALQDHSPLILQLFHHCFSPLLPKPGLMKCRRKAAIKGLQDERAVILQPFHSWFLPPLPQIAAFPLYFHSPLILVLQGLGSGGGKQ